MNTMNPTYKERKHCVICNCQEFDVVFSDNFTSSLSLSFTNEPTTPIFMPFNVLLCTKCSTAQTKYLGDLSIVYDKNHNDTYGSLKSGMMVQFANFINENEKIEGILEVGACNDALANCIQKDKLYNYFIVEPNFTGNPSNITIIKNYAEEIDFRDVPINTIVMSHLFEHLYEPLDILSKIENSKNIKNIYLNHPDFEHNVRNNTYVVLNSEHTFYIEHNVLIALFQKFGFVLRNRVDYQNHSLFLQFEREETESPSLSLINMNVRADMKSFFGTMTSIIRTLHEKIKKNPLKDYYMWPASAHSISLFACGFDTSLLKGLLDNSPNKIGKYLHTYNLYCSSFSKILEEGSPTICIIITGAGQYIKEIQTTHSSIEFCDIRSLT